MCSQKSETEMEKKLELSGERSSNYNGVFKMEHF